MKRIVGILFVALALIGVATTAQADRTVTYTRTISGLDPDGYFILGTTALTVTIEADSTLSGADVDPNSPINKLTSLGFFETLPMGWSYTGLVAGNPANPTLPPVNNTGEIGFAWITPPAFPFSFGYTISVPDGEAGPKTLTGRCDYRTNGNTINATTTDVLFQQKPTILSIVRTVSGPGVTGDSNQFYVPGQEITIDIEVLKDGPKNLTALKIEDILPANWTYTGLADALDPQNPTITPPNNTGTIGFSWIAAPAPPFSFAYKVLVPANEAAQDRTLTAQAEYRFEGNAILSNQEILVLDGAPCTVLTMDGQGGNFYSAGATKQININVTETCAANITALAVNQTLPTGWTYTGLVAGDADNPTILPVNNSGTIQFAWIAAPAAPFTFSYNVTVPALDEGDKDVSGNIEYRLGGGALFSENFTLTLSGADLEPPVITLNGNATENVECGDSYTDAGATATDNRDGDITANIAVGGDTVDTATPGTYVITFNVSDLATNAATEVTRTVTVEDTTDPTITLNGNAAVTVQCGNAYTELGASASDGCDTALTAATPSGSVDTTTPGDYTITYNATDASGNAATPVTRTVTVADTTPPTINASGPATINVECHAAFTAPVYTATDLCDGALGNVNGVGTVDVDTPGTYTLTYNVSDGEGNAAATVTRTVVVADTTDPVVTTTGGNGAVTLECGGALNDPGATATDVCDASVTATSNAAGQVNLDTRGDYVVTYSATDDSGNVGTATRVFQVRDTTDPVLTVTGGAATVECGAAYTDANGTANDTCDSGVTVSNNAATVVDTSNPGVYTVTITATDDSGNTATATRQVTVSDTIDPIIALTGGASVTVECGTSYNDAGATASDGCDGSLTGAIVTTGSVDTATPGSYTITYNVDDSSGNSAATVTRSVTVSDSINPVITLNGNASETIECGGTFTDAGATATDSCEGDLTSSIVVAGDTVDAAAPGSYTITYTVADGTGNTATASRTVTVADTTDPVITLNGNASESISCGDSYTDAGATATDSCDSAPAVDVDSSSVNPAVAGTYTVTITATDASGNTATATRTVVVGDTVAPVVTLNGDAAITLSCLDESYTDDGASANDACSGDIIPVVSGQVEVGTPGVYTITYSATDASGNVGTATRTVTVTDDCVVVGPCDDANGNGLADDIFACLDVDGESIALNVDGGTCTRRVYAVTWFGSVEGSDIDVVVTNPNDENQVVTVSVGRDVIGAGQQAILVVSIACTLEDLLGDQAFNLGTTPDGEVAGNAWFDVSIVVSNDGGATYEKLDNSILETNPVTITINGLNATPDTTVGFQSYDTYIAPDDVNGAQINAVNGESWTGEGVESAYNNGTLTGETTHLSVFGSFEQAAEAAVLEVTPNPAFDLVLGTAQANVESITATITVKNTGGGTLTGAATASGAPFTLVGDATYTLAAGASDTITVRFTPTAVTSSTGTLTLTNSAGAPVTITLKGTGTRFAKKLVFLGCGESGPASGSLGGDLAVISLVLGGLYVSSRAFRRAKQS